MLSCPRLPLLKKDLGPRRICSWLGMWLQREGQRTSPRPLCDRTSPCSHQTTDTSAASAAQCLPSPFSQAIDNTGDSGYRQSPEAHCPPGGWASAGEPVAHTEPFNSCSPFKSGFQIAGTFRDQLGPVLLRPLSVSPLNTYLERLLCYVLSS